MVIIWSITIAIILMFAYFSFGLHQYSAYHKLMESAFSKIQKGEKINLFPAQRVFLIVSLEQQLTCATTKENDWVAEFKKDSAQYPENIVRYAFQNMLNFDIQVMDMNLSDSILTAKALVSDRTKIIVYFRFVKRGDVLSLINLEGLCPLFKRMNCYREYIRKTTGHP